MISAIIITKNTEKNIERAVNSVRFCDEVMVIKNDTIDDFARERNKAMDKAKGEWVLFIDADEVVSEELKNQILKRAIVLSDNERIQDGKEKKGAYYIKRRDFFWGKELQWGEVRKIRQIGLIRLMRKDSGKWVGKVHEEFRPSGDVGRLEGFIDHYPHPTIKEFLLDINIYSTIRARELRELGDVGGIWEIIFYPLGKFLLTYFIKFGFLDGPAGFAYAFFMSFHSFLVRAKLYQYTKID